MPGSAHNSSTTTVSFRCNVAVCPCDHARQLGNGKPPCSQTDQQKDELRWIEIVIQHAVPLCFGEHGHRAPVVSGTGRLVYSWIIRQALPEQKPEIDTVLTAGEVITAVDLPSTGFAKHSAYFKVRDLHSYTFALVPSQRDLKLRMKSLPGLPLRWAVWRTNRGARSSLSRNCWWVGLLTAIPGTPFRLPCLQVLRFW